MNALVCHTLESLVAAVAAAVVLIIEQEKMLMGCEER